MLSPATGTTRQWQMLCTRPKAFLLPNAVLIKSPIGDASRALGSDSLAVD